MNKPELREPRRPSSTSPTRAWIRRVFPLADGVTYLIAAGVLASTWTASALLEALAAHLAGAP